MRKTVMARALVTALCLLLLPLASMVALSTSANSAPAVSAGKAPGKATKAKKAKKQLQKQRKWCRSRAGKWARQNPTRYAKRCSPPARPAPSAPPPAIPSVTHCGTISGNQTWTAAIIHRLTCSVTIPAGASLTIAPNTVIKANPGVSLTVLGTLRTQGSWSKTAAPTNPVTFTSSNDNSIGGATGNVTPTASDWQGIVTDSAGAVAQLDGVVIRHAAVALESKSGYDVRIRGVLRSDATGVKGNDDWVDARWVDWGDVTLGPSPSPSNAGIKRTGASVTVVPWIGMATPPVPTNTSPQPPPHNLTCTDVVVYGLRYSGADPQAPFPNEANYGNDDLTGADGPAQVIKYTFDTMSGGSVSTKIVAVQYPALAVPEMDGSISYADFFTSFYIGGQRLVSAMRGESARCPNTRFVATGYSQGAAAIRMGLGTLTPTDPLIAKVGGLVLLGDPGKPANTSDRLFSRFTGGTNLQVGSPTLKARAGYFATAFPEIYHEMPGTLPSKTWDICHETDFVCAAGPGTKFSGHAAWYPVYTQDEIAAAAHQIGDAMVNGYPPY